jgi:hypothetical protein
MIVIPVMIVVVIIPIAVGVPAIAVHIPPFVFVRPAIFTCFVQFVPCVVRLLALISVMFHRFVQFVVRVNQPVSATVCFRSWRSRKQHKSRRQCGCTDQSVPFARRISKRVPEKAAMSHSLSSRNVMGCRSLTGWALLAPRAIPCKP